MAHPDEQAKRDAQWLISPELPPGARVQLASLLEAERLSPEVLELLAKFTRDLQQVERPVAAEDPCPKLDTCNDYHRPCTALTMCGIYTLKAAMP